MIPILASQLAISNINASTAHVSTAESARLSNSDRYRHLITRIADFATTSGAPIRAFNPSQKSRFHALPDEEQLKLIALLETYDSICTNAVRSGLPLQRNGLGLAWWAMRYFKLRPLSDVFSYLKPDDIIEIYDRNDVQIFRTFDFFKCVSYSLDEVYTYSWWELYERADSVTSQMLTAAKEVGSATRPFTLHAPFPTHSMIEKFSARRLLAQVESRLVSTLIDVNGEPRAYMNAFSLLSITESENRASNP